MNYAALREESMPDRSVEGEFELVEISDPVSPYFFLSNDAQDEIELKTPISGPGNVEVSR